MDKSKSIQKVSEALLCSNCGACKAICPKDAISYASNSLGRVYAEINNNCINCGLCSKVCPSLDIHNLHNEYPDRFIGIIQNVYIGRSTNIDYFRNAQSGGVCTSILAYLFDTKKIDGAILCRMLYGNPPIVESVIISKKEDLDECQKSCYTPVDLLSALRNSQEKKSLAIVGLPCHIQGAVSLYRESNKYQNIKYKIGLICDRTLCGGIQDVIMSYCLNDKVKIEWRKKNSRIVNGIKYSYKNAPITILYKNGQDKILSNLYRFSLKDYFTSPRCRVCYDKLNTFSDIVVGDPWGMSDIDWEAGASVVITRNNNGEQIINEMLNQKYVSLKEGNIKELLNGQHIEARRKLVACYSKALSNIPVKINSYLYELETPCDKKQEESANKEIIDFLRRDILTKNKIISESQYIIKKQIRKNKIRNSILFKIISKIKKRLKFKL